jgi:hypothetical protein
MATYNGFRETPTASPNAANVFVVRARADFRKHNLAASDDLIVAKVPTGVLLLGGWYRNVIAEGSAATVKVGTTAGGSNIVSGANINSVVASNAWTQLTLPLISSGSDLPMYGSSSADVNIYVRPNAAVDNAVLDLMFIAVEANDVVMAPANG